MMDDIVTKTARQHSDGFLSEDTSVFRASKPEKAGWEEALRKSRKFILPRESLHTIFKAVQFQTILARNQKDFTVIFAIGILFID